MCEKFKETHKRYTKYFLRNPLYRFKRSIRLRHLEIMHGPHISDVDEACNLANERLIDETESWKNIVWKNHLNMPPEKDQIYWSNMYDLNAEPEPCHTPVLTKRGIKFIRDQYRIEKSYKRELFIKWSTLIFAGIAAFGVLITQVSVFN